MTEQKLPNLLDEECDRYFAPKLPIPKKVCRDFGAVIDQTISDHRRKPVSDQALFLAVLAPWFALGFGSIGYAIWWASR